MYSVYIFLSEVHLEQEEQYEDYLRIIPECFHELFVQFVNGNITIQIPNMRDRSSPQLKLATKIFHVHSFVLFS